MLDRRVPTIREHVGDSFVVGDAMKGAGPRLLDRVADSRANPAPVLGKKLGNLRLKPCVSGAERLARPQIRPASER